MNVLGPENLCYMEEKEVFFLSDWSKLFETGADDLSMKVAPTTTSLQGKRLTSQELAGEIQAVALSVLKLNKIDLKEIEMLRQMKGVDPRIYNMAVKTKLADGFTSSKTMQDLIERMLSLEPQNLPNLDDLQIHKTDFGTQVLTEPVVEESNQIKETAIQISSQIGLEEMNQVQIQDKQAISTTKKLITVGKSILMINLLLIWLDLVFNRGEKREISSLACLVLEWYQ